MFRLASVVFPHQAVTLADKANPLKVAVPLNEECKEPEFEILHKIVGLSKSFLDETVSYRKRLTENILLLEHERNELAVRLP
jgi:hypothetical protein